MSTSILAETLASMTPEQIDGIQRLLDALKQSLVTRPPTKRPRARPRPVVALPADVTPAELARARDELTRQGIG